MFKSIPDKTIVATLHVTVWLMMITIPLYLSNAFGAGGNPHRLYQFFVHSFSAAIIFYVGYLWLVPAFFLRERKMTYAGALIGLILITYVMNSFVNEYFLHDSLAEERVRSAIKKLSDGDQDFHPPMKVFGFYNHVIVSVLISGFAIGLCGMEKLKKEEKKQKELEKEKLNSELAFLKNQVSPHFFFNTLNNIYSLIGIDAADAREAVLKLSKLMRYLLYESEQGLTGLNDEIAFMINYIDLMKLRLNNKVELSVSFPEKTENPGIPPLLFIPFIENAFKHGISYREPSFIDIKMTVDGAIVCFSARNSIGASSHPGDGQYSGIGLENVKKRLSLLFPGKHVLKIEQTEAEFLVDLRLETKITTT